MQTCRSGRPARPAYTYRSNSILTYSKEDTNSTTKPKISTTRFGAHSHHFHPSSPIVYRMSPSPPSFCSRFHPLPIKCEAELFMRFLWP
jgi:hypothetical protein